MRMGGVGEWKRLEGRRGEEERKESDQGKGGKKYSSDM